MQRSLAGASSAWSLAAALALIMLLLTVNVAAAETRPPSAFGPSSQQKAAPPAFASPSTVALRSEGPFGGLVSWVVQTQTEDAATTGRRGEGTEKR